jgi:hypothetical protein
VKTIPANIERPSGVIILPEPEPIVTNVVKFKVLTKDTLPNEDDFVYYGLEPEYYEALSENMSEILRWVSEAEWQLRYYRGEIEEINE